jgi:hypothetical protein
MVSSLMAGRVSHLHAATKTASVAMTSAIKPIPIAVVISFHLLLMLIQG